MEEKRSFPRGDLCFIVYKEYFLKGPIYVKDFYGLGKEDINFIIKDVEKKVCDVFSFSGDLGRTAKQCLLPELLVRKIVEPARFISDSKKKPYEFMVKKEKF